MSKSVFLSAPCSLKILAAVALLGGSLSACCCGDQCNPPIAAGDYHTCAMRTDNTISCWGHDDNGESTPPAGAFRALDARAGYSCALTRSDARLVCWGSFNL